MTSLQTPAVGAVPTTRDLRPAASALFVLLVVSQLAIVVFSLWEPPFDGAIRYDDVAPIRGAYWPMNVLLGGPGYALGAVAASVFLGVLGAGRGSVPVLIGAAIYAVAGVVFALVITAEVLPFAWAADPAVVGEARGRALFDAYNGAFDGFLPYILGSMAVAALGTLLAVTGAAISGGLPWWVLGVAVALVAAVFALPTGSSLGLVVDLAQAVLWVYIGWRGLRTVAART